MFRQRVITALILLPVVIGVILAGPRWLVLGMLALGMLAAAWEWAPLAGLGSRPGRAAYTFFILVLMVAGHFWLTRSPEIAARGILLAAGMWWLLALALVLTRPRLSRLAIGVFGTLAMPPAWLAAVMLYDRDGQGVWWLMLVLVLVWAADVGAYFAGRLFGRHKLAPSVSPGKTWEGFAGGVLLAVLLAVLGSAWLGHLRAGFLGVCALAILASVLGDLTESLLKRQAGIKDSGALLPGHGGVLDRLDSLLAALPVFALGQFWLERGL